MSNRDSYTSDEWSLILTTPTLVSAGVAAADPSGIVGALKEATAGASAFAEFADRHRYIELFRSLAEDKNLARRLDLQPLWGEGDSAQQSINFRAAVIARSQEALSVVTRRGTAQEAAAYGELLRWVADNVANAATEGSVLGFGGVRVSDNESVFLAALSGALAARSANKLEPEISVDKTL